MPIPFFLMTSITAAALYAAPVKVIFDTDLCTDYDDAGALAMLHAMADNGEAEILATVSDNTARRTVACVELINAFYGRPDIPVGCVPKDGVLHETEDWIEKYVGEYPQFKHGLSTNAPDAVAVYRQTLAAAPDKSVTVIAVGFMTNLRLLLQSADGKDLAAKKVKQLVCMAGQFPHGRENNVWRDALSAKYVFENWPTPILFSGWEIGINIRTGLKLVAAESHGNPIREIYKLRIGKEPGHPSWDQTAVLVAIRGCGDYFGIEHGIIRVSADGSNTWEPSPDSPHSRLLPRCLGPMSVPSLNPS